MTQTNHAVPPGQPRFCSACGGPFPGPVPRCPRCGAVVGRRGTSLGTTLLIVAAVAMGGICILGILAAIAIPNFIRYQLRAKQSAVTAELDGLVKAERAAFERGGHYLALGPLPSQPPSSQKNELSAAERDLAASVDWMVDPATYGQFRVIVAQDGSGLQAASLCAESDLDGDGVRSVHVAFLPLVRGGQVVAAPPAPCTDPVPYADGYAPGQVVKVSEDRVF